jgi:hypothetical protein
MKRIRQSIACLALLGLSGTAIAQGKNCLSQGEMTALIGYALPDLIVGVRDKCKATLPASAFLSSRSGELEARYRAGADAQWPQAKAAFLKMMGDDDMVRRMPDSAVRPFLTAAFATAVTDDLKASDCAMADGIVEELSPLPPANLARLIGLIIAADDKDADAAGKSGFAICG